ncbi:hypothetical protein Scep_013961 [Stephania cephalantha]|uniref:Pentatricopeptide repeat-containing protein n=1 Tax=Stephania cephalantha TaxID=152367 RepID=A0AAP0J1N6_9MAGN
MLKSQKLHTFLLKKGFQSDVYQCNLLLKSYIESRSLSDALNLLLFNFIPTPNVVSYNTLISGLIKSRRLDEALDLLAASPVTDSRSWNTAISGCARDRRFTDAIAHFLQMRSVTVKSVRPDNYTYAIVIPCCGFELGLQIHGEIVKLCADFDVLIGTNLVKMYGEMGKLSDALRVFDEMPERDLVAWNALISCCCKYGMGGMGFRVFRRLFAEGVGADEFTYATVLNLGGVVEGMQVHSLIVRSGFSMDRFTCNSLINLYSKCGIVDSAVRLFEEMPEVDEVSWTSMIVGLSQSGFESDAFKLFGHMRLTQAQPNSFTFGGLFNACATINSYEMGKQCHCLALKFGLETDMVVGSAIIDMYSKCGVMSDALQMLRCMPEKDVVCWNAMICGFAQNGEAVKALNLFEEMVQSKVAPNDATFIGVLSACNHGGLVNKGCQYFADMIHEYLIAPKTEHYTCMVEILAKAGLLREAEALIMAMPFKPDNVIWGVLLGACKLHGKQDMAKCIAERLWVDEPKNSSNYVLLANIYTAIGEWNNASGVRESMDARGAQKMRGCSWIEIKNEVHSFVAGDKYHPQIESVYEVLHRIQLQMEGKYNYRNHFSLE